MRARSFLKEQTGVDYLGIVEYQQCVVRQQAGERPEAVLSYVALVVYQQLGGVALFQRELGNTAFRQRVVVVGNGYVFRIVVHFWQSRYRRG